ncbi:MAG: hypothetical protein M1814_006669 [Vezdaea aestivalis]|nr:MAG: hypothetical protein M1814_006669 [Vezdaea aestivalis]
MAGLEKPIAFALPDKIEGFNCALALQTVLNHELKSNLQSLSDVQAKAREQNSRWFGVVFLWVLAREPAPEDYKRIFSPESYPAWGLETITTKRVWELRSSKTYLGVCFHATDTRSEASRKMIVDIGPKLLENPDLQPPKDTEGSLLGLPDQWPGGREVQAYTLLSDFTMSQPFLDKDREHWLPRWRTDFLLHRAIWSMRFEERDTVHDVCLFIVRRAQDVSTSKAIRDWTQHHMGREFIGHLSDRVRGIVTVEEAVLMFTTMLELVRRWPTSQENPPCVLASGPGLLSKEHVVRGASSLQRYCEDFSPNDLLPPLSKALKKAGGDLDLPCAEWYDYWCKKAWKPSLFRKKIARNTVPSRAPLGLFNTT